jgi:hypothetical protein
VYSCNLLKLVICVIFFIYLASKLKKIKNLINSMRYFFYQCSFFTQYLLNYDEHNSLTCEVFSLRFAWDLHGRDRMVVGFTTTYVYNQCLSALAWVRIPFRRGVLDTTLCDIVCQWLATGWWFSLGTPVSSINKTDCHDIAEILLKVALNTITLTLSIN